MAYRYIIINIWILNVDAAKAYLPWYNGLDLILDLCNAFVLHHSGFSLASPPQQQVLKRQYKSKRF
jgi:hypothetical protein